MGTGPNPVTVLTSDGSEEFGLAPRDATSYNTKGCDH